MEAITNTEWIALGAFLVTSLTLLWTVYTFRRNRADAEQAKLEKKQTSMKDKVSGLATSVEALTLEMSKVNDELDSLDKKIDRNMTNIADTPDKEDFRLLEQKVEKLTDMLIQIIQSRIS